MSHSKGSCDDEMSSDMLCSSDFGGFTMSHSKGPCGDATSSDMLCPMPKTLGAYDESFERVLRRCDVVRHAMCPRFLGG